MKGKTNIKCLSKVLGHHSPPEGWFNKSAPVLEGWNSILLKDIPLFSVLMMGVQSAVFN